MTADMNSIRVACCVFCELRGLKQCVSEKVIHVGTTPSVVHSVSFTEEFMYEIMDKYIDFIQKYRFVYMTIR